MARVAAHKQLHHVHWLPEVPACARLTNRDGVDRQAALKLVGLQHGTTGDQHVQGEGVDALGAALRHAVLAVVHDHPAQAARAGVVHAQPGVGVAVGGAAQLVRVSGAGDAIVAARGQGAREGENRKMEAWAACVECLPQ